MQKSFQSFYKFATQATAYGLVAVVHKGFGFMLFFWLAHSLSQSEYAVFGLLYALQTGLIAITTAGVVEMVIGQHRIQLDQQGRQRLYGLGNTLFLYLGMCSSMGALGLYFIFLDGYATALDVVLILVGGIFLAFFTLQASFIRLDETHGRSLILLFIPSIISLICAYVGFAFWGTLTAFFGSMAISLLVIFIIFYWMKLIHLYGNFRINELIPLKGEIAPYIVIALLAWLTGYGSTYLVEYTFDVINVAKFTFVYTLSSVLQIAATALNQVWSPRFFRVAQELSLHELERRNTAFYGVQGLVLGMIGAVMLLLFRPSIDMVGGNLSNYRDMGHGLAYLFAGYAMAIPWWHLQNYYYAHKKGDALMKIVTISSVLGLLIWLGLMMALGVSGIYMGFFMLMFIRSLAVWLHARSIWSIRLAWHGPLAAITQILLGALLAEVIWP